MFNKNRPLVAGISVLGFAMLLGVPGAAQGTNDAQIQGDVQKGAG